MIPQLTITLLALTSYLAAQTPATFHPPTKIQADGHPITIPDGYTFPTCIDLDLDGLKDIVVGETTRGIFYFHKNTGTLTAPTYSKAQLLMVNDKPLIVPGMNG